MPNTDAVFTVSNALINLLASQYPDALRDDHPCNFQLLSGGELANPGNIGTTVSLYLYRISQNEHRSSLVRNSAQQLPLALNLHYLLSIWSNSAMAEQRILIWAMQELYRNPTLTSASLPASAGWRPDDVVHVVPAELSTEDVMRIWDAVNPGYRLSVPYTARVIPIRPEAEPDQRRVVVTHFAYDEHVAHDDREQPA